MKEEQEDWAGWSSEPAAVRLANGFTAEFVVRYMSGTASLFDFDYDRAVIFLALIVRSEVDPHRLGETSPPGQGRRPRLPDPVNKPVSRMEIARVTGLPRETVRRKIIELMNKGFVLPAPRGGVVAGLGLTAEHDLAHVRGLVLLLLRYYRENLASFAGAPAISEDLNRQLNDPAYASVINAFTVDFMLRYMLRIGTLFKNDFNSVMVFLFLLEASSHAIFRDTVFLSNYATLGSSLPLALSKPISRLAIARGTGISRETVRRKVAGLVEKGVLQEHPDGGVCVRRGVTSEPGLASAQAYAMELLRDYGVHLLNMPRSPERLNFSRDGQTGYSAEGDSGQAA